MPRHEGNNHCSPRSNYVCWCMGVNWFFSVVESCTLAYRVNALSQSLLWDFAGKSPIGSGFKGSVLLPLSTIPSSSWCYNDSPPMRKGGGGGGCGGQQVGQQGDAGHVKLGLASSCLPSSSRGLVPSSAPLLARGVRAGKGESHPARAALSW